MFINLENIRLCRVASYVAALSVLIASLLVISIIIGNSKSANEAKIENEKSAKILGTNEFFENGTWILEVQDQHHQLMQILHLKFTNEYAESCIGGEWKKVKILSNNTIGKQIFPGDNIPVPIDISYEFESGQIRVGRTNICDGYLFFQGNLEPALATGQYYAVWLGGGKDLGFFKLYRNNELN